MNRAATLRVSLLVSLGLVPIACGSTTLRGGDDEDGAGTGNGGRPGGGGTSTFGGKPSSGKPSKGGTSASAGSVSIPAGGSGGAGANGGATSRGACTNGKRDPVSGLLRCAEGYNTRPSALECELAVSAGGATDAGGAGGAASESAEPLPRATLAGCDVDRDCSQFQLGYCQSFSGECDGGFGGQSGICASGCALDADCGPGFLCLCDGSEHGGQCVRSTCRIDADCGSGQVCASLLTQAGLSFACTSNKDECATDMDCQGFEGCELSDGRRQCLGRAVCGRPFLVDSTARLAPVADDGSWTKARMLSPRVDHLTVAERAALAAHWTKLGQMEHASIAAFARFSLQLLALGAPPSLVEACTQALADETAHTQLCFGLASAYAGRAIGPGRLDVANSLDVISLADVVDLVIVEGCFGETSAALEALDAADSAADPVIAAAYAKIAADEQRHAELAFAFVRWALERDPAVVSQRVNAALAAASNLGRAARSVAKPCLQALLAAQVAA